MTHINIDELIAMAEAGEYIGQCTNCGTMHDGIEPDAVNCKCESCGRRAVCGVEVLLNLEVA